MVQAKERKASDSKGLGSQSQSQNGQDVAPEMSGAKKLPANIVNLQDDAIYALRATGAAWEEFVLAYQEEAQRLADRISSDYHDMKYSRSIFKAVRASAAELDGEMLMLGKPEVTLSQPSRLSLKPLKRENSSLLLGSSSEAQK